MHRARPLIEIFEKPLFSTVRQLNYGTISPTKLTLESRRAFNRCEISSTVRAWKKEGASTYALCLRWFLHLWKFFVSFCTKTLYVFNENHYVHQKHACFLICDVLASMSFHVSNDTWKIPEHFTKFPEFSRNSVVEISLKILQVYFILTEVINAHLLSKLFKTHQLITSYQY